MNFNIVVLILSQLLFTSSDLIARFNMARTGFGLSTFLSLWFLGYFLIRTLAMFGQLYVFSNIQLGKSMALFGAVSIILSNILGFFLLKEALTPMTYFGIMLAVLAFIILSIKI